MRTRALPVPVLLLALVAMPLAVGEPEQTLEGEGMIRCAIVLVHFIAPCHVEGTPGKDLSVREADSPTLDVGSVHALRITLSWTAQSRAAEMFAVTLRGGPCEGGSSPCEAVSTTGRSPLSLTLPGSVASGAEASAIVAVTRACEYSDLAPVEIVPERCDPEPSVGIVRDQPFSFVWSWT